MLEKAIISGVAHTDCEPLFRVRDIDAAKLFARSRTRGVNVDTILQVAVRRDRLQRAARGSRCLRRACSRSLDVEWSMRDDLGKVSLVGAGMKSHPGIAAKTFATLEADRRRVEGHLDVADQDRVPRRDRGRPRAR